MPERSIGAITIDRLKTHWAIVKVIPKLGLHQLVEKEIVETGEFSNEGKNLDQIAAEIALAIKRKCSSLTVSSFGPFVSNKETSASDKEIDTVPFDTTISRWQTELAAGGTNLRLLFHKHLDLVPAVITDATAMAIGEFTTRYWRREYPFADIAVDDPTSSYRRKTLVALVLGKGIGGGFIVGGQTYQFNYHPEMGHMPVQKMEGDDRRCACRFHRNCVTGYLGREALDTAQGILTDRGIRQFAYYAAQLCATIGYILGPHAIVLMGNTVRDYPESVDAVRDELARLLDDEHLRGSMPFISQEDTRRLGDYISAGEGSSNLMGTIVHGINRAFRGAETSSINRKR